MHKKVILLVAFVFVLTGCASAPAPVAKNPQRVLIVVFDQMRPEYAERFGMKNVLDLQKSGVNFTNGYLGHLASETVVSHNVMVSGLFPRNMGWVDEAYRDTHNLLGKGANVMWETAGWGVQEFGIVIKNAGYPKLADYLHRAKPGTKFIAVGEKGYAVDSVVAPSGDIGVRVSGRQRDVSKDKGCDNLGGQWRYPAGVNVPAYLTEPKCGRFYINSDSGNDYTTKAKSPSWLYPLDGDRFVPGRNPQHLGGDVWVADAAMAMMEKENWSGMLVTLGGIDKAGHMWGAHTDQGSAAGSPEEQTRVPYAVRVADQQFGRMLQKLRDLGQLDETLIVITADHGATFARQFHGVDAAGASDTNWYYGKAINTEDYNKPSPALKPLIDTGNVQFSYQSTMIEVWLKENSAEKKRAAAQVMRTLPGVAATYWREGDRFQLDAGPGRDTAASFGDAELAWWKKNGQALVDTMAADNGPDVIALLADDVGYGVYGDHGGAKASDQRIPMVVWASNIRPAKPDYAFRTVDILPTVLKAMRIQQGKPVDGRAWNVEFR
jgi:hypothetical protein